MSYFPALDFGQTSYAEWYLFLLIMTIPAFLIPTFILIAICFRSKHLNAGRGMIIWIVGFALLPAFYLADIYILNDVHLIIPEGIPNIIGIISSSVYVTLSTYIVIHLSNR